MIRDPAFPTLPAAHAGLSRRELLAAMAMQGFLAANLQGIPMSGAELARRSLACADALIAALDEAPNG